MKPWQKCLQLLTLLFIYLSCGAFMILKLEEDHVSRIQQEFFVKLTAFVQIHYKCGVRQEELLTIMENARVAETRHAFYSELAYYEDGVRNVWSWPNSILFASSVVTTIGYGRLAPVSTYGQIFCIWYAVFGIPLCCAMLSAIGDTSHEMWLHFVDLSDRCFRAIPSKKMRRFLIGVITTLGMWCLLILLPSIVFTKTEPDWSWWRAQYFCFVTFSTIGFGDVIYGLEPEGGSYLLDWIYKMSMLIVFFLGLGVISIIFKGVWHSQRKNIYRAKDTIRRKHKNRTRKYDLTMAEGSSFNQEQNLTGYLLRRSKEVVGVSYDVIKKEKNTEL